jgi:hypothetical protein
MLGNGQKIEFQEIEIVIFHAIKIGIFYEIETIHNIVHEIKTGVFLGERLLHS